MRNRRWFKLLQTLIIKLLKANYVVYLFREQNLKIFS